MKACNTVGSTLRHMISHRRDREEIITLVHQKTIGTLALLLTEHVNLFIEHSLLSMNDNLRTEIYLCNFDRSLAWDIRFKKKIVFPNFTQPHVFQCSDTAKESANSI